MMYSLKRLSPLILNKRALRRLLYVLALLALAARVAGARQRAEIIPFPIDTIPMRINRYGEIAGVASWDQGGLFLYKHHRMRVIPMRIFTGDALVPTGLSINARGTVVGCIRQRHSDKIRGFVWRNEKISFLSEAGGSATDSYPNAINGRGKIVGDLENNSRNGLAPCAWSSSHIRRLTLGQAGLTGDAFAINNRGQIAGDIDVRGKDDTDTHPVIWRFGKPKELGLPTNYIQGAAMAINNRNVAVGWVLNYRIQNQTTGRKIVPCVWGKAGARALPVPSGYTESAAAAVNDVNEIVGTATGQKGGKSIAMLWIGTKMFDLNSFLPSRSRWKLFGAYGINDAGDIVGDGTLSGHSRGYLLRIMHEPGKRGSRGEARVNIR